MPCRGHEHARSSASGDTCPKSAQQQMLGLPATIEAFFALPDEGSRVTEGRENWMRKMHRDFLKMYQLTVEDVPRGGTVRVVPVRHPARLPHDPKTPGRSGSGKPSGARLKSAMKTPGNDEDQHSSERKRTVRWSNAVADDIIVIDDEDGGGVKHRVFELLLIRIRGSLLLILFRCPPMLLLSFLRNGELEDLILIPEK